MTDKEIMDCIFRTQKRVRENKFDYVGAIKCYCRFRASGEKSFISYLRKHDEANYGWKNMSSLAAGITVAYKNIKDYVGRDFWQELADQKPEMEIVPPEPKAPDMAEFMAGVLIGIREIKLLIKENTNVQRNLLTELVAMREGMKK